MKAKQLSISLALGLGLTLALLWLLSNPSTGLRVARAATGDVYCVTPRGGTYDDCDRVFTNVQAAVDAATGGEEIRVAAGTYTDVQRHTAPPGYYPPTVITQVVYINKTITICGGYTTTNGFADPPDPVASLTTLDAQGQGRVLFITGNIHPTIEGLHITGGNAAGLGGHTTPAGDTRGAGGGVYVFNATAIISNNQVFNNAADFGGGLYLKNNVATLSGNIIRDNSAKSNGGGLFVYVGAPTLSGNTITDNKAENGGGGLFVRQSDPTLSYNTIAFNIAEQHGGGLRLAVSTSATLSYNTIAFNIAEDQGGGLYLANYCTATLSNNDITANTALIGGGGLNLVTSTAWLRHNTIKRNIARFGGGLRLSDYSSATLSHNTIKANTANFGGGLFLALTSTATISDNTFIYNSARGAGGGLKLAQNGSARLISNTITANTAYDGGGMHLNTSTAELSDNIFAANEALHAGGGLMLAFTSTATLSGNTFAANETKNGGSGLFVAEHSSATLNGDIVISNTADTPDYGGGAGLLLTLTSTVTCTNTIIADNRLNGPPGLGAGLVIADSSARLLHTTIAHNSGGDGSGIHVTKRKGTYSTVALTNTILVSHEVGITVTGGNTVTVNGVLWYNTPITVSKAATATVTVQNEHEGDPAFVDPDAGDYHIGSSSAALDASRIDAGVYDDIDGDIRPFDGDRDGVDEFDIGADEFPAALSVAKQASVIKASVGETITYTYMVTNTGNVTLTDLIADDYPLGAIRLGTTALAPAEITTGTAKHTVVTGDLPGPLTNTVTVTGTSPLGHLVTYTHSASVTLTGTPAIEVDKEASVTTASMEETIIYTYTVENIGDVTLTNVSVSDDRLGTISLVTTTLAPGEITTGTATHTVQESDLPGPLKNTVTVTATPPVTDTDSVSVILTSNPAIKVAKETSVTTAKLGDTIAYTYTVTNTGDVTLNDIRASDNRRGAIGLGTTALAPGDITTGTATYVVQGGDWPGPLVNTVTVTGTSLAHDVVTATNGVSVALRLLPCPSVPAFGAVLLVLLSVVLRRKK